MNESSPKWADGPEQWRQGTQNQAEQLATDLLMTGNAYTVDGKRVPPEDVLTYRNYPLHSTPEALDGLAEQVADMLDNAMHLEACWISEDETRCVCLIAALRAALPRCGHVENIGVKGLTRQCLSTVHPSAAYKHVFGTV